MAVNVSSGMNSRITRRVALYMIGAIDEAKKNESATAIGNSFAAWEHRRNRTPNRKANLWRPMDLKILLPTKSSRRRRMFRASLRRLGKDPSGSCPTASTASRRLLQDFDL